MTHKIIQWNCCGYKTNYGQLLLIAEPNPTAICLQEIFKKHFGRIHLLHLCRIVGPLPRECPGYDKQPDGEVPVMLEL